MLHSDGSSVLFQPIFLSSTCHSKSILLAQWLYEFLTENALIPAPVPQDDVNVSPDLPTTVNMCKCVVVEYLVHG